MTACRNFKFDVDNSTVMKWLKMEYFCTSCMCI